MPYKKIPVLIFTGFLGAGKTTVINSILKSHDIQRIAVIENELGSVSIDTLLLKVAKEQIIEITQGCLCCSVRGDFIEILKDFEKREKEIDLVIIELSGASEIDPVIETFGLDEIRSSFKIDSIWGVYDISNIDHRIMQESELARRQLEACDVIVANKATNELSRKNEDLIRTYNAHAYIYHTKDGSVDSELSAQIKRGDDNASSDKTQTVHEHNEFQSFTFIAHGYLRVQAFRELLDTLPNTLYRIKGFVRFIEAPNIWYLVQRVGYTTTIEEWYDIVPGEEIHLIGIGKDIDISTILTEFHHTKHMVNPLFQKY